MIETKPETSHQWIIFSKGRMRVEACSNCGDLHLPSNTESQCSDNQLTNSQIVKAGYCKQSEIEEDLRKSMEKVA